MSYDDWKAREPEPQYQPVCADCGALSDEDCDCDPPVTHALGFEGPCEHCGRLVVVDERVRVYGDDVVVHEQCPVPRACA